MARGQAGAAEKQLATTNKAAAGYGANAGALFGPLTDQAQALAKSTGWDPTTLGAVTNAGMGGVNAGFDSAAGQVSRNAATSRNPAGVGGELDALARSKGIAGGKEAGDIQIANAQFGAGQREQGLNLLNSLYGTNVGAESSLYGMGPATLQARAAGPSGAQDFASILKAITGSGSVPGPGGSTIGGGAAA